MDGAEFDQFADEYYAIHTGNIAISGEQPAYFAEYKIRDLVQVHGASQRAHGTPSVLDFGAGVGTSVPYMRRYMPGAKVSCLDVSEKSLAVGRTRFGQDAEFVQFDGTTIPFDDSSFDVVFAACVFHHIDHGLHVGLLRELHRVLAPGGTAMIYEHNPYNPLTRHAVNTCPFDKNARLITASSMRRRFSAAGFAKPVARYRVFFPGMLAGLRSLEGSLTWLPLGAQYYVAATK